MTKPALVPTAPAVRLLSRRELLAFGAGGMALLVGCGASHRDRRMADASPTRDASAPQDGEVQLEATPACEETEDNIEGPFYKSGAPERSVLVSAMPGVRLSLAGRVLDRRCHPIADATVDLWQADDRGAYDLEGFTFRGKVRTDATGAYTFQTIVPGRYLNGRQYRPAHLHAKVSAPGIPLLTTQLYFAGDPFNGVDPFIRSSLIMNATDVSGGKQAQFDFVLAG